MTKFLKIAALSLFATVATGQAMAADKAPVEKVEQTKLGVLECTIDGGFGLLIGSSKDAVCNFTHADGTIEVYTGKLNKLGLDVGISGESYLSWVVFTPLGNEVGSYALAGKYAGVSASAAVGVGLGANALIGGSDEKFALQPLSVEGKTGLNLAVGFSSFTLTPADI